MAFELSDYVEPTVTPQKMQRTEFKDKMENMPVGKAVIVTGMTQGNVSSRVNQFKIRNPEKRFVVLCLIEVLSYWSASFGLLNSSIDG